MSEQTQQAVSPVVAVILMVAVTVILSAVIGTFVLDLGQQATSGAQSNIGVSTSYNNGDLEATIITGTANEVKLLVNGSEVDNITPASPGDVLSATVKPDSKIAIVSVSDGDVQVVYSSTIQSSTIADTIAGPTQGLVAYWPMSDSDSLDTVVDEQNNYDGDMFNDTSYVDTSRGTALYYNGSDGYESGNPQDYVSFGDRDALEGTGEHTLSVWVKYDDETTEQDFISKWNQGTSSNYLLMYENESDGFRGHVSSDTWNVVDINSQMSPSPDTWYHVVQVYNDSADKLILYVNGTMDNSTSTTISINNTSARVLAGTREEGGGLFSSPLDGHLQDVRVYDRALNSSEVSDLYNATK